MTARPILFSGPMVRALQREVEQPGTGKTQTRRIVKPDVAEYIEIAAGRADDEPATCDDLGLRYCAPIDPDDDNKEDEPQWCVYSVEYPEEGVIPIGQGYGARGDLLWVRETCQVYGHWIKNGLTPSGKTKWRFIEHPCRRALYEGQFETSPTNRQLLGFYTRPSIFMPRWASRLTLELTDVRIERVQDISEADALAEGIVTVSKDQGRTWKFGIPDTDGAPGGIGWPWQQWQPTAREAFFELLYGINKRAPRDENPWVWALTFRVHQMNIDQFLKEKANV